MDKIDRLKEEIINLRMLLIETHMPKGYCPYTYYSPSVGRIINCDMNCERCRKAFMVDMEIQIRKEVENI